MFVLEFWWLLRILNLSKIYGCCCVLKTKRFSRFRKNYHQKNHVPNQDIPIFLLLLLLLSTGQDVDQYFITVYRNDCDEYSSSNVLYHAEVGRQNINSASPVSRNKVIEMFYTTNWYLVRCDQPSNDNFQTTVIWSTPDVHQINL